MSDGLETNNPVVNKCEMIVNDSKFDRKYQKDLYIRHK